MKQESGIRKSGKTGNKTDILLDNNNISPGSGVAEGVAFPLPLLLCAFSLQGEHHVQCSQHHLAQEASEDVLRNHHIHGLYRTAHRREAILAHPRFVVMDVRITAS